jgi:hypothetical protein
MLEARKNVVAKTYLCKYKDWSCSFMVAGDDGEKVSDTILFVGGEFSTDFLDEQKHLEALPQFSSGIITLKPSPIAALESKALALRAAAVKANAEAKDAESALAAMDKPVAKTATV